MCTLKASKNARLLLAFFCFRVFARLTGVIRDFGRRVRIRVCCGWLRCLVNWLVTFQAGGFGNDFKHCGTVPPGNVSFQSSQAKLKNVRGVIQTPNRNLVLVPTDHLAAFEAFLAQGWGDRLA